MTIRLQGKWEAERVANLMDFAAMLTATDRKFVPWLKDCAERIRRQVEAARGEGGGK